MGKPRGAIIPLLGWKITGDFGPFTFYTSRRGKPVWFPKAPPLNPASTDQLAQRAKYSAAGAAWQTQTAWQKAQWELAAQKAYCKCTGYNLFVHYIATDTTAYIDTISRQSGIILPPPP